jgi:type III secretion protein T
MTPDALTPHAMTLTALITMARSPMAAFSLGIARGLGLLQILPISSRLGLLGMHRAAVAAAVALLLLPLLMAQLAAAPPSGVHLVLLAIKEGLIGFLLGVIFAVPFWVAEATGELIDQQRGSTSAVAADPAGEDQTGTTATLLVLTLTTIFMLSGGMHWLIDALYRSYLLWPAGELVPRLASGAAMHVLGVLDSILASGLLLASPLVVAMLLVELSVGFINRFMPQLNVFLLSMPLKGLVQVIGLPIYAVFLIAYLRGGLAPLQHVQDELRLLSGS